MEYTVRDVAAFKSLPMFSTALLTFSVLPECEY